MAAGRDHPVQDFDGILSPYDTPAVFLALALQDEDADKFIEVYDNVISEKLTLEEIDIIKDKARDFASLPPDALATLAKQCSQPVKELTNLHSSSTTAVCTPQELTGVNDVSKDVTETNNCAGSRILFSPTKCVASEMEGSTLTSGTPVCRNVPCQSLPSESDKIWNNNNNYIETCKETLMQSSHGLSSVDQEDLNKTDCVNSHGSASKFVTHYSSNLHDNSLSPLSKQELLGLAVELIDSGPCQRSSTCPKPAYIDQSKPGQGLQVKGHGQVDMAAASSIPSSNTKKTELKNVRLSTVKTSSSLPNGSVNNKKLGVSALQRAAANLVVPNAKTPLMGNSQRTDSSVCVYGTNVPSEHQAGSVDSDGGKRKGKERGSDSPVTNKPATLGEQFEASKAQEGKKKKSKKKKKNKVQEAEKMSPPPSAVAANNDKQDEQFQDALAELPPATTQKTSAADNLNSNEDLSAETQKAIRQTIASKMLAGSFHVKEDSTKTSATSTVASGEGGRSSGSDSGDTSNCKDDTSGDDAIITTTQLVKTDTLNQTDIDRVKTEELLSNDKQLYSLTPHEINEHTFHDARESTNYKDDNDDDGEFQEVASRKSRRFRNKKGASMEDKFYPYSKTLDNRGNRGINSSLGMRKSSSEPTGMARLGDMESDYQSDNNYVRKLSSKNYMNTKQDMGITQPPIKQNIDSPSATISYAGKVKAGITPRDRAQQTFKNSIPVKFTLDDEHSDGHVSDSSIVHIDATTTTNPSQRTSDHYNPTNPIVLNKDTGGLSTPELSPKYELARTSPKFEISFGEFPSVNISGAPKSLKDSAYGLDGNSRPFQKVTRSNSVNGLEKDAGNENQSSTTQLHHQEANVQYLDLQSTNNTYAGMLKKRLPSQGPNNVPAINTVPKAIVTEPLQTAQIAPEVSAPPKPTPTNPVVVEDRKFEDNGLGNKKKPPHQVVVLHSNPKVQTNSENKSHPVKGALGGADIASPTPSITSSSKGKGCNFACYPLNMEPMDLGITFGNVDISEVLKGESIGRDSPVDKILATDSTGLPHVPSTGQSCTDLESSWKGEIKDSEIAPRGRGDAADRLNQRESFVKIMTNVQSPSHGNFSKFNYYEVADMLMKAWMTTVEQQENNPSEVQYYIEPADACI